MSNLMHKVKDAMTGHHDSSTTANKQDDIHGSHGATATTQPHGSSNYNPPSMSSSNYQGSQYPAAHHDNTMGMGTHGPNAQYGSSDMNAAPLNTGIHGIPSAGGTQGIGSTTYGTGTGGHGSNINAGPHQSKLANKLDPRVDSDLDNRGAHGTTTAATTTGPTGGYSSNYGAPRDNNLSSSMHGYNTRSSNTGPGSNMANPMGNPTGAHVDNRTQQPGFGGAAAGGSSYNAPDSGKRGTSGPHSSNLLNKLDPRVHSSDHGHANTTGNQRGL